MEQTEFRCHRLMLTTFIISGCSMIYELLISSVSSYLLGDSISQFSITIGLYLCAMGLGSYLSRFLKALLFDWFVLVEIGVGAVGGMSALLLFLAHVHLGSYQLFMYLEIIGVGVLSGLEIPLLTRIIDENAKNLRVTLSSIFSFDYIGGLAGSIAFPILLLPQLGYFSTAFLVGAFNLAVSLFILASYWHYVRYQRVLAVAGAALLAVLGLGMIFSETLASSIEDGLYRDRVILSRQTQYQKIVVTKHRDDIRLFINGNIQFSSRDEYRYHESLVHIPMSAAPRTEQVLILGGGDGLAAREVLKYPSVQKVTLVDLDPGMITLCRANRDIAGLNNGALDNPKVEIHNEDAYQFLQQRYEENSTPPYDVILVDLPDPNNESLNRLYTDLFYRLCRYNLADDGVMAVQSTSPYFAPDAFWCIHHTIAAEGFHVYPYHTQVPSFGDWGFQLASPNLIEPENLTLKQAGKFLTQENLPGLFLFARDELTQQKDLKINRLSSPRLLQYYYKAEEDWD